MLRASQIALLTAAIALTVLLQVQPSAQLERNASAPKLSQQTLIENPEAVWWCAFALEFLDQCVSSGGAD